MTEKQVALAGAALFAAYLPIALWTGRDFVPAPKPPGAMVVPLLKIEAGSDHSYRSELFTLRGRAGVMLYEDLRPLGAGRFFHEDGRMFVGFSASDTSDPRVNGRNYWLVLP